LPIKSNNTACVLDGEIVAVKKNGKPDFHALQDHIRTGKGKLIYYVFDILYIENFDLKNRPLIKRKKILKNLVLNYLPDSGHIKYLDHIKDDGLEMFEAVIKSGLEGMIAKDGKSGYEPGRRTGKWLKIKSIKMQEAIIVGLTEPRGSRKYFGSLILAAYNGNELKYIGHSGGGFSDEELRDLKIKLEKFITNKPPIKVPPELKNIRWLKPKIVCQIKFAEWTPDGLMRQPVYMGIRSDKDPRDVKIEK
jgi:bifunctional non-homologous end joining protein LigD